MRILLASTASFEPPRGGSTRGNRVWLEYLAAHGHACRVVCAPPPGTPLPLDARIEAELPGGIRVLTLAALGRTAGLLATEIRSFAPDWVLVSSEDLSHSLLAEAHAAAPGRVIYLAHTPQFFPFGPESWSADKRAAERVRECAAVVTIGHSMADYVRRHGGVEPRVIHPNIYGSGPFESYANFDGGFALMVNPCAVKGLSIFAALAREMPGVPFAALAGWGTTADDRAELDKLANVTVLEPVRRIEEVLRRTRVLLMPSLWYEGFGLIVMEAMLRGIPVIASDSGGLAESKQGTGYVAPVAPIRKYRAAFDEMHMPLPAVPEQRVDRWAEALRALLGNRDEYRRESERSQAAATEFVGGLRDAAFLEMLESLKPGLKSTRLKILLAHNSLYFPSHGGGDKSNRLLMEALVERGHTVQVFARLESFGDREERGFLEELAARGTNARENTDGGVCFERNGVSVFTATSDPRIRAAFARRIDEFDPDVILCSTDDPGALLLEVALRAARARIVYLVRATVAVPFGPDCSSANAGKTEMLGRVDSIVGVSEYVAEYVRKWSGFPAIHVPISLLEPGDYSAIGRFENEWVLMVNPCAVKGISIFTELADAMPDAAFAAIPTWGTNAEDLALLRRHSNIRVLEPVDDMAGILRRTKVVLVPSVWAEARSRMVVEAMIRGIPVIASDVGGLHEAKLGVEYLLPVNPIQRYHARVDANMVPVAEIPPQEIRPWVEALRRLMDDRAHYEDVSNRSRAAALRYAETLHCGWLDAHIQDLVRRPRQTGRRAAVVFETALEQLSPAKRQLLALRMRRKEFFPAVKRDGTPVLFCFPWAGGGATGYRQWSEALSGAAQVCAARLPGRESRLAEQPYGDMNALVEALAEAVRPHLSGEFAFFGHSMGAGIAFELARSLRRKGLPLPAKLIVSSARAPQLRTGVPDGGDVSDEELMTQLRRLGGFPEGLPENTELLKILLPVLRADTHLYRRYVYEPDDPLPIPIQVYGGDADPSLTREQFEGWRAQTSTSFAMTLWPGGHFFFRAQEAAFLRALRRDLLF